MRFPIAMADFGTHGCPGEICVETDTGEIVGRRGYCGTCRREDPEGEGFLWENGAVMAVMRAVADGTITEEFRETPEMSSYARLAHEEEVLRVTDANLAGAMRRLMAMAEEAPVILLIGDVIDLPSAPRRVTTYHGANVMDDESMETLRESLRDCEA